MFNTAIRLLLTVALAGVLYSTSTSTACASEADDQFAVAASHYSAKRWDLAVAEFRAFLRDYPDHAKHGKAMFLEAESLVQMGRSAEAYPLFVDLLADEPTGSYARQALFGAGEAAVLCGKTDEAELRLSQFQSQYPSDKLNATVLIYRGDVAQKSGDSPRAEQLYRQSLEKFADMPTADDCRLKLAHLLETDQQPEAAEALLHDVAQREHSPYSEMALLRLAGKELAANRPQSALEQYEAISKRYPDSPLLPQTHLGCGQALYQLGHFAEAESVLASLTDNPELGSDSKHLISLTKKAEEQAKIAADSRRIEAEAAAKRAEDQVRINAETRRMEEEKKQAAANPSKPKQDADAQSTAKADNSPKADSSTKTDKPPVVALPPSAPQSLIKSILSSRRDPKTVPSVPAPPALAVSAKPSAVQPQPNNPAYEAPTASANPAASGVAANANPATTNDAVAANPAPSDNASPADSAAGASDGAITSNAAAADSAAAATISASKPAALQPVPPEVAAAREEQSRRRSAMIRFQEAEQMMKAKQFERAIATLQMGDNSGDDPRSLANRYLLAMALHECKREDESLITIDDLNEKLQAQLVNANSSSAKSLSSEDLTELHTLNDSVQLARATALLTREKYAEAIVPLQMYLATPRNDVGAERARSALAISLTHVEGHVADAERILEDLKTNHPSSPLILPTTEQVADAAYAASDFKASAALFKDLATDGNPPDLVAKGLSGLAWSELQQNEDTAAAQAFSKFLAHFPADSRAPDAALACAQILERQGNDNAALAVYREAIKHYAKSPQMPKFLHAAARLYDRVKQSEDAAPLYQRIVHDYPTYAEIDSVLYSWGWALRDLGRTNESDKVFRMLYDNHSDSRYWSDAAFRLAERASLQGDNDTAEELLKQIVDGNCPAPILQHALFLQAQIAIGKEKWPAAEAPLNQLIRQFPDSSMRLAAEFWLGEMAYRSGDYVTAQQRFETLAPRATSRVESWTGLVPLRRAQIYAEQKQWAQALTLAESIAHDFPQFSQQFEADYLIGRCLAEQADFDGARGAFDKVVHSTTGSKTELAAIAQWMIGETYSHQGNYSAALREYLRTEVVYPYPRWQAAALLQAAKCYEQLGQPKQASEMYARVLQNYPQTEFVAEASKRLVDTSRR